MTATRSNLVEDTEHLRAGGWPEATGAGALLEPLEERTTLSLRRLQSGPLFAESREEKPSWRGCLEKPSRGKEVWEQCLGAERDQPGKNRNL